jgi:hypothetical protein
VEEKKLLTRITALTDSELETDALNEAWKDVEKHFLNPEITSVIGYLATFWSALEHLLFILIRSIHRMDDASMLLMIEMPFLQRVSVVTASLSLSGNQELFDEWCEIEKELTPLRAKRNDVIHGFWSTKETEHFLARMTAKGKFRLETSKYDTRDVQKIVVSLFKTLKKMKILFEKLEEIDVKHLMTTSTRILDRTQSPKARAQAQARALKKSKRPAPQGPKLSSAQKRVLRDAENQKKDNP